MIEEETPWDEEERKRQADELAQRMQDTVASLGGIDGFKKLIGLGDQTAAQEHAQYAHDIRYFSDFLVQQSIREMGLQAFRNMDQESLESMVKTCFIRGRMIADTMRAVYARLQNPDLTQEGNS